MKKQTKLVAILSTAALLAVGASMTSFAAGWEKDDSGIWHYYDSDEDVYKRQARQCTEQGMELTVQLHKFF